MSINAPYYVNELEVSLSTGLLTNNGATSPQLAIDDDPTTATNFLPVPVPQSCPVPAASTTPPASAPQVTPNVTGNSVTSWFNNGANYAAGCYQVIFTGGGAAWNAASSLWSMTSYITDGNGNSVVFWTSGGNSNAGPTYYTSQALLDAGMAGKGIVYSHNGGQIGVMCADAYTGDNGNGDPNPTFALIGPLNSLPPATPRFIAAAWNSPQTLTRIRLMHMGAGAGNAAVLLAPPLTNGNGTPDYTNEVLVAVGPQLSSAIGTVQDIVLPYPVIASAVIYRPDYLIEGQLSDPSSYPAVDLYQFQVYEQNQETIVTFQKPSTQWTTVGIQLVKLYPYTGGAGSYTDAQSFSLGGLQSADVGYNSTLVEGFGGESVWSLFNAEVKRELSVKFQGFIQDLSLQFILWNGSYVVDPANTNGPEVQYIAPMFTDRAPEFRVVMETTLGDVNDMYIFPRCRVKGSVSENRKYDAINMIDFEVAPRFDKTYVRLDGLAGGAIFERIAGVSTVMHS